MRSRANGTTSTGRMPRLPRTGELRGPDEDHEFRRRGGDDLLPHERAAVTLDEIEIRVNLIGTVHRQVDAVPARADQWNAEPLREIGRSRGPRPGRHGQTRSPELRARRLLPDGTPRPSRESCAPASSAVPM